MVIYAAESLPHPTDNCPFGISTNEAGLVRAEETSQGETYRAPWWRSSENNCAILDAPSANVRLGRTVIEQFDRKRFGEIDRVHPVPGYPCGLGGS